jgi:ABC-type multidrug transport system fused ATPase/permease subunit
MDIKDGLGIEVKNLKYKFPNETDYLIKGINLKIGQGEKICLSGYSGSGKTTFINILLGFLPSYEGVVAINGISLRELNKNSVINHVGDNISQEDLFDGTILENITLGRNGITMEDVLKAVDFVGLHEFVQSAPDGFHTHLVGGNMGISESVARKIIIARSIAKKPKLLIIEDYLLGLEKEQRMALMKFMLSDEYPWTVIIITNDEEVMKMCDRTLIMKDGQLVWAGDYENTVKNEHFTKIT